MAYYHKGSREIARRARMYSCVLLIQSFRYSWSKNISEAFKLSELLNFLSILYLSRQEARNIASAGSIIIINWNSHSSITIV